MSGLENYIWDNLLPFFLIPFFLVIRVTIFFSVCLASFVKFFSQVNDVQQNAVNLRFHLRILWCCVRFSRGLMRGLCWVWELRSGHVLLFLTGASLGVTVPSDSLLFVSKRHSRFPHPLKAATTCASCCYFLSSARAWVTLRLF